MTLIDAEELIRLGSEKLSKKRMKHVLNVRNEAVKLAKRYGLDVNKCETAALLHDITKELKFDNQLQIMLHSGIILNDVLLKSVPLYHAVTAYVYAKEELQIEDPDILNAIRYHTTARGGMSRIEKAVYIADAISEDRHYKEVEEFRRLAMEDLDECMLAILKHTIRYLVKDDCLIPSDTMDAYNELAMLLRPVNQ